MIFQKTKLSESKKLFIQRRLSYFLKSFRLRNEIPPKQMADVLGYSRGRYSQLESDKKPYDKLITSIEFLESLGSIERQNAKEFLNHLWSCESDDIGADKKIIPWQENLVARFEKINTATKFRFVDSLNKIETVEEKHLLESFLEMYIAASKSKSDECINSLVTIIKEIIRMRAE